MDFHRSRNERPRKQLSIHNSGYTNLLTGPPRVRRIVIHATCPGLPGHQAAAVGQAEATLRYFASPAAGGSAHYITDVATTVRVLDDAAVAWHAPPNRHSIGIEIGGEARWSRADWEADDVWPAVVRGAELTRDLCAKHGVPMLRVAPDQLRSGVAGICGHVDVSQAWRQSDHSDPGAGFPWDRFMEAVSGGSMLQSVKILPAAERPKPTLGDFPLPQGNWFGPESTDPRNHSGFDPADRPHVQRLQHRLGVPQDGAYGPRTAGAVAWWQTRLGLTPDRLVGAQTWAVL